MKYKVAQWATGNVGAASLRQMLRAPNIDVVGLYVYSPDKEGRDAGEIVGEQPIGVRATRDIAEICASDAETVMHNPLNAKGNIKEHDADVIRLLEAGKNVISTAAYVWPWAHGEDYAQRFVEAAERGKTTLLGAGLNPGFIFERLGVLATAGSSDIREIRFGEVFDCRRDPSPGKVFDTMGMGITADEFRSRPELGAAMRDYFVEVIHAAADALHIQLDSLDIDLELGLATEDLMIAAGLIPKDTVAGTTWNLVGHGSNGTDISLLERWIVGDVPGWDVRNHWFVETEGRPAMRMEYRIARTWGDPRTVERYDPVSESIAAVAVNAIPAVVAEPPGLAHPALCASVWTPSGPGIVGTARAITNPS
jgi:2,4-diaminopentanoate dehydrogenase